MSKNTPLHILTFLWCLFVISSVFVTTNRFADGLLLPKWYATACSFAASSLLLPFTMPTFSHIPWKRLYQWICVSTSLLLLIEMSLYLWGLAMPSSHSGGITVGHFDRTTGLASCVSIAFPLGLLTFRSFNAIQRAVIIVSKAATVAVVVCCGSRTGVICVAGTIVYIMCYRRRIGMLAGLAAMSALVLCCYSLVKTGSSAGRWFILMRTLDMIVARPVTGWGHGGFQRHYMDVQADYFASHPESSYQLYADNIHHPLNEYLLLAVDYGLLALLACGVFIVLVAWFYRHHRSDVATEGFVVLTAIGVYSFFTYTLSYPFTYAMLCLGILTVFAVSLRQMTLRRAVLLACLVSDLVIAHAASPVIRYVHAQLKWKDASQEKNPEKALTNYDNLSPAFTGDFHFLYDYACVAFEAGEYGQALEISRKAASFMSDYQLTLLTADCFEALSDYGEAIGSYERAHQMCPSRIVPCYEMYRIYSRANDTVNCRRLYNSLMTMPIKVNNYLNDAMFNEVERDIQRFNNLH